jgi:hypothetical protein
VIKLEAQLAGRRAEMSHELVTAIENQVGRAQRLLDGLVRSSIDT